MCERARVCVYVCVRVLARVSECAYVCVNVSVCTCACVCMCVCVWCLCVRVYVHVCVWAGGWVHMCRYVRMCVCARESSTSPKSYLTTCVLLHALREMLHHLGRQHQRSCSKGTESQKMNATSLCLSAQQSRGSTREGKISHHSKGCHGCATDLYLSALRHPFLDLESGIRTELRTHSHYSRRAGLTYSLGMNYMWK